MENVSVALEVPLSVYYLATAMLHNIEQGSSFLLLLLFFFFSV